MSQKLKDHDLKIQDELIHRLEKELRLAKQQVAEKDIQIKALMLKMNQVLDHHIQRRYARFFKFCQKIWSKIRRIKTYFS